MNNMTTLKDTRNAPAPALVLQETQGLVYCLICTHRVEAVVQTGRKVARVKPGQRCPRCKASLDAGSVLQAVKAA